VSVLDYDRLMRLADERRADFEAASPFPHIVIDDFLPEAIAESVRCDFPAVEDRWKHYTHYNEKKLAVTDLADMPDATQRLFADLQSERFVEFVGRLTGIEGLISDPELEGAGMHMIRPKGFLNIHADFLTHTKNRTWSRQLNLLIYLNRDWQEEWDGNLELWDAEMSRCEVSVPPIFNRCVLFHTIVASHHGHPHRLRCPDGDSRKSLAIYYYRDEGVPGQLASTNYRPLPTDSPLKKVLIAADRGLLAAYTWVKGRTGLSDKVLTRLLKRF
jgi:Rps23 Pro-64 3,4-dihydroxylase Tpa1-like proline 4-hydroxylase